MRYILAIALIACSVAHGQQSTTGTQVEIKVVPVPGSPTYGIQEALNQVPAVAASYGTNVIGATIHLKAGDYYLTNGARYGSSYKYNIKIIGSGVLNTRLFYVSNNNARTNLLRFDNGGTANPNGGLDLPAHVELQDMTFSSLTNDLLELVCITNCSEWKVRNCNFTGYEITTNQTHGAQLSIDGPYPTLQPGNVGLVAGNLNDHAGFLEDCFFANLASGFVSYTDHLYAYAVKSAFIGVYIGGGSGADGNGWANTSVNSLGSLIILKSGLGAQVILPHFYIVNGGIANDAGMELTVLFPIWEQADHGISWFNPSSSSVFTEYENYLTSDTATLYAINHSPYSYSSTTALIVQRPVFTRMISSTGLNGNNNSATNFAVFSVQTNLMAQPAGGFTPNFNKGYEVARTNTGPVVFAQAFASTIAGDFIHYYFAINNTGASDQALIFPAPYITNGSGSGPFRVTNICYGEIFGTVGVATNVVIHQGK